MAEEATLADVVQAIREIPPAADESYFSSMQTDIRDLLEVARDSHHVLKDVRDSLNGVYDLLEALNAGQQKRYGQTLKALEDINQTTKYLIK